MESITELVSHILPPARSTSSTTTAATTSEPTTPNDSTELEPLKLPVMSTDDQLEHIKVEKTKTENKPENIVPAPAAKSVAVRPTLPHAKTDTEFEVIKETERVERRWRGMYDRNRAANPGATRKPEK